MVECWRSEVEAEAEEAEEEVREEKNTDKVQDYKTLVTGATMMKHVGCGIQSRGFHQPMTAKVWESFCIGFCVVISSYYYIIMIIIDY